MVALPIWLATVHPANGQEAPAGSQIFRNDSTTAADPALSHLLGPWLRDDSLSEDPIGKNESMWRSPELVPHTMRVVASGAAERLSAVELRLDGEHLLFRNSGDEQSRFYIDGRLRTDPTGDESQVLMADGTLTTEVLVSGWLVVETFYRRDDQLLRMTEIQNAQYPSLRIRTVYEYAGDEPPPRPPAGGVQRHGRQAVIRILPPKRRYGELLSGRVEIQTLAIDPLVSSVDFFLDGRPVRRIRKHPFNTDVELAKPPREQTLEARAQGFRGEYAGNDRIVLNRLDAPFAVGIAHLAGATANGAEGVRVEALVSVPSSATLERVDFYRSEDLVATVTDFGAAAEHGAARKVPAAALIPGVESSDFIRVSATLADGRTLEDATLVEGSDHQSEIDLRLVQLQVLATDHHGNPVSGLSAQDFEIRESGRRLPARELHTARDVPLVLGLTIDSSTSMEPIWQQLKYVAGQFLQTSLASGDRVFLVDFDAMVRLLQPLTGNKSLLSARLNRLIPFGGTALNDGLLFSLLQYGNEPGRRALVVMTDGLDENSRSRPQQATEFAERLGLPIYFIELDPTVTRIQTEDGRVLTRFSVRRQKARKRLERICRQTGGRLFHVALASDDPPWTERIEQVFDRIEEDLRHQHVLTYYTDQPPGAPIKPEVRVIRPGLKLRSAVPLEAIE